jgi:hypothetical protein
VGQREIEFDANGDSIRFVGPKNRCREGPFNYFRPLKFSSALWHKFDSNFLQPKAERLFSRNQRWCSNGRHRAVRIEYAERSAPTDLRLTDFCFRLRARY